MAAASGSPRSLPLNTAEPFVALLEGGHVAAFSDLFSLSQRASASLLPAVSLSLIDAESARARGDNGGLLGALRATAAAFSGGGEAANAGIYLARALATARGTGDVPAELSFLVELGANEEALGNEPAAVSYYESAASLAATTGDGSVTVRANDALVRVRTSQAMAAEGAADLPSSLRFYRAALAAAVAAADTPAESRLNYAVGRACILVGDVAESIVFLAEYVRARRSILRFARFASTQKREREGSREIDPPTPPLPPPVSNGCARRCPSRPRC